MDDIEKGIVHSDSNQQSITASSSEGIQPPSPTKTGSSSIWSLLRHTPKISVAAEEASSASAVKSLWPWRTTGKSPDPGLETSEFPDDEDDREPIVRQLHSCPAGYSQLAAFLDSDDNFMVYRRFGYLHARVLLQKQEQLRQLEFALDALDKEDAAANSRCLITMENYETGERSAKRRQLMESIEAKLLEYDSFLQSALALAHCSRPSSSEYTSVENFVNNRQPLVPAEQGFVYHKEDLLTLRPGREHAWLDSSVEKLLKWSNSRVVQNIFCSKETRKKTDGVEVYYTRQRIDMLVVTIIVLMILVLLVVPVCVLSYLTIGANTPSSDPACMGIMVVSTLAFAACISLFTKAQRHEILAASAAYCAVLVVFISNIGGRGSGVVLTHH